MSTTFIDERRKSIGGTDVAAICGINPYKTPFNVFQEKMNNIVTEENVAMRLGRAFESGIAKLFSEEIKLPVFSPEEHKEDLQKLINDEDVIFVDVDYHGSKITMIKRGIAHGSLDYFTIDDDGTPAVVECKLVTNNFFKSKEEFIVTNPHYYMQIQWYMYVTGFRRAYFATVQFKFGGNIEWYQLEYNEKVIEKALAKAEDFWNNHILTGKSPEPTNPDELNQFIDFKTSDDFVIANEDIIEACTQLKDVKEKIKSLDENKEYLEKKIKMSIYDKIGLMSKENEVLATYKVNTKNKFVAKKLEEDDPETYKKYVTTVSERRFLLK